MNKKICNPCQRVYGDSVCKLCTWPEYSTYPTKYSGKRFSIGQLKELQEDGR